MNFSQYRFLKDNLVKKTLEPNLAEKNPLPATLVLAYLGDAIFSLYVRKQLTVIERNKVRVLNDVSSVCVSAIKQAKALDAIMSLLSEKEADMVRRGRNTKSSVPKSATVNEYRKSTGFECLLGWLYWNEDTERLYFLMDKAFIAIMHSLREEDEDLK